MANEPMENAANYVLTLSHLLHRQSIPRATLPLDDLVMLVRFALCHEEITMSRAAELLGLCLEDMRVLTASWSGEL